MFREVGLLVGLVTALPATAGEMTASEARNFVTEKLFSYSCFDGTRGVARVHLDGFSGWLDASSRCRPNALRHDAGRHIARRWRARLRVAAQLDRATVLLS